MTKILPIPIGMHPSQHEFAAPHIKVKFTPLCSESTLRHGNCFGHVTQTEAEKVLLHWSLPYLLLVFGTLRPQCEEAQASLLEDETMDSREACPAEAPQQTPRPIPHPYNWPANCSWCEWDHPRPPSPAESLAIYRYQQNQVKPKETPGWLSKLGEIIKVLF